MEISPTGYVVLGILNWSPRTGYEIKQLVDRSTRFFWAASYGQIYPELKRLERQGLVSGRSEPQGGRKRRVYSLTAKGTRELTAWLERPPATFEMRNEGLLKLFLSSAMPADRVGRQLDEMRAHSEELVARLGEIEQEIGEPDGFRPLCLRFGIEMNEWIVDWCERQKQGLARDTGTKRRAA
jgi:DNA-binding PadR family transcriptional regulator